MLSEKVKVKGTDEIKPTVIFEVGVSEPYSDLQSDMYQWLTKSSDVQLVVLVDIKEDHKMRKTRWETPECKQRVNELLRDFGNAEGNAKHGRDESVAEDSPDEDARSNEDLYKSIKQAIEVDDWVGPIEVHVELWETGDQGPQKRGNRIRVIPQCTNSVSPVIKVTDSVPPECRRHFSNFDPLRKASLDLNEFRRFLLTGKKKLAYYRAVGHIRPRRR